MGTEKGRGNMSGYTRLFSSILASSIWNESDDVRIIWITLLAMSDRNGHVDASVGGIAHQARKTRETTEKALTVLEAPDPDSKNPANEGRRIKRLPNGGLMVLNYQSYRDGLLDDAEAVAARERQRKHREKQRDSNVTSRDTGAGAGDGDGVGIIQEGMQGGKAPTRKPSRPEAYPGDFESFWTAYPKKVGKRAAFTEWKKATGKPPLETILAAIGAQESGSAWMDEGGKYIPDPERWLKKGRWDDVPTKPYDPYARFLKSANKEQPNAAKTE
jgi:hypothetical protein